MWARIRTLYGFNTVIVALLQVVVLMNEFDALSWRPLFSSLDD